MIELLGFIILIVLISNAIGRVSQKYGSLTWQTIAAAIGNWIISSPIGPFVQYFAVAFVTVINIVCLVLVFGIVYSLIMLGRADRLLEETIIPEAKDEEVIENKNPRWQRVVEHLGSKNPGDWRLAVLEADIVLDELLDTLGYTGDTIGDKLKKVARGDFIPLDQAWEAHRIRNAIAHEGHEFMLSEREARRIIGLYEQVFRSFNFI